jgi:four helix bundle protein
MHDIFDVPGSDAPDSAAPRLDFERLDVYRVAVEFHALASSLRLPAGRRELRDQLDRAALSIVLNTAEGGGRTGAADKARFYAMARGSAMECAALFDLLGNLALVPRPLCVRARGLLVRIVQMHTRLCLRLKA